MIDNQLIDDTFCCPGSAFQVSCLKNMHGEYNLKYLHMNAQSLGQKQSDLEVLFSEFNFSFDVVGFSETWFSSDDPPITFGDYSFEGQNRISRGGGVALYVRNGILYHRMNEFCITCDDYELLVIKSCKTLFAVIYRTSRGTLSNLFSQLEILMTFANENEFRLILQGDLNIDILTTTSDSLNLLNLIRSNGYFIASQQPTRYSLNHNTNTVRSKIRSKGMDNPGNSNND